MHQRETGPMRKIADLSEERAPRGSAIALVVIPGVIALTLGVIDLGARSIWLDESASISIASQHGAALGSALARDGGNMAGYYVVLHALDFLFGNALIALRLPSVLAAAVTSATVAHLADRLFGRRAAIASGLLSAVSLPAVYWSQDVRSYALLAMFVSLSYLALLHIEQRMTLRDGVGLSISLYVAASTAALYCSFVAAFVLLAQLILVSRRGRLLRVILAADVATIVLSIPLALLALERGSGQLFWIQRPNWPDIRQITLSLLSAGFEPNFPLSISGAIVAALTAVVAAVALLRPIVVHSRATRPSGGVRGKNIGSGLVVTWCAIPLVASFLESYLSSPTFTARNLLIVLPGMALALGWFLQHPALPNWAAFGLLALLVTLRLLAIAPTYGKSPENWQAATTLLVQESEANACLIFYPQDTRMALDYYLLRSHPAAISRLRSVLPNTPLSSNTPELERYDTLSSNEINSITASCPELWLVASHQGSASGTAVSRAHYARFVMLRTAVQSRYASNATFNLGWAATVTLERLRH